LTDIQTTPDQRRDEKEGGEMSSSGSNSDSDSSHDGNHHHGHASHPIPSLHHHHNSHQEIAQREEAVAAVASVTGRHDVAAAFDFAAAVERSKEGDIVGALIDEERGIEELAAAEAGTGNRQGRTMSPSDSDINFPHYHASNSWQVPPHHHCHFNSHFYGGRIKQTAAPVREDKWINAEKIFTVAIHKLPVNSGLSDSIAAFKEEVRTYCKKTDNLEMGMGAANITLCFVGDFLDTNKNKKDVIQEFYEKITPWRHSHPCLVVAFYVVLATASALLVYSNHVCAGGALGVGGGLLSAWALFFNPKFEKADRVVDAANKQLSLS
jgi:hypothetical protein